MHNFKRHQKLLRGNKKMKKLFSVLLVLLMTLSVQAKNVKTDKCDFSSVINDSGVEKNSIAISIKDLNSGKPVYELNERILMHPASVQKVLTLIPAVDALGDNYEFTTTLYERGKNNYIVKLGADPFLTSSDLKNLVRSISPETERIYVDNSILEKKDWGEGWQWDDDMNVLMPRFNSYNLDGNLIKITIMPTQKGQLATIINPSKYPLVFLNNVVTSDKNDVSVSRDNSISANTLSLKGTVNKPVIIRIPTNNLKRYFDVRLANTIHDRNIYLKENFITDTVKSGDKEINKVTHPISEAIDDILKNSNNMTSETVSKLAGGKMYDDKGTDINGIKVFNAYCKKIGLDNSKIRLTDASGVSKNNLISADFISEFLIKTKDNPIMEHLPAPGEGTLTHRMLPIKDNLKAKTGTHGDLSSIAGFLTTKKGNKYAFCIIINDTTATISDMKMLEDYLIREAYLKL